MDDKSLVCHLLKPLYGLRQSGRHWYRKFASVRVEEEKLMVLAVHVDDCSVMASSVELGEINWILGIAVKRDHGAQTIALSQKSYITSMLGQYGFENLKPIAMPMDPSTHLSTSQSPKTAQEFAEMKNKPYREAVGSLMYASLGTRPDITYAVGILSRFVQNPGLPHWNAVK